MSICFDAYNGIDRFVYGDYFGFWGDMKIFIFIFLEVLFVILRHKVYLHIRKIATFVIVICSNVWNYEQKNALAIRKMSFGGCSN